ncbi:MAG: hypothetical protein R2827_02015 [Bdellovibrionales bacterium]
MRLHHFKNLFFIFGITVILFGYQNCAENLGPIEVSTLNRPLTLSELDHFARPCTELPQDPLLSITSDDGFVPVTCLALYLDSVSGSDGQSGLTGEFPLQSMAGVEDKSNLYLQNSSERVAIVLYVVQNVIPEGYPINQDMYDVLIVSRMPNY